MAEDFYIGVDGQARRVVSAYVGVDGVAREITGGYVGIDGVAKPFFSGGKFDPQLMDGYTSIGNNALSMGVPLKEHVIFGMNYSYWNSYSIAAFDKNMVLTTFDYDYMSNDSRDIDSFVSIEDEIAVRGHNRGYNSGVLYNDYFITGIDDNLVRNTIRYNYNRYHTCFCSLGDKCYIGFGSNRDYPGSKIDHYNTNIACFNKDLVTLTTLESSISEGQLDPVGIMFKDCVMFVGGEFNSSVSVSASKSGKNISSIDINGVLKESKTLAQYAVEGPEGFTVDKINALIESDSYYITLSSDMVSVYIGYNLGSTYFIPESRKRMTIANKKAVTCNTEQISATSNRLTKFKYCSKDFLFQYLILDTDNELYMSDRGVLGICYWDSMSILFILAAETDENHSPNYKNGRIFYYQL